MQNSNNVVGKQSSYDEPMNSPEERVKSFISHWYEQWLKAETKSKAEEGNGQGFDLSLIHI